MKTKHFSGSFSKNTFYRFLNDPRINWLRFTTLLALAVIRNFFKPLTSYDRADVFIIDDSLYERAGYNGFFVHQYIKISNLIRSK